MAVTPDDLLAPAGPLDAKLFPGEESNVLAVRLARYISNAEADGAVLVAPAERQDPMVRAHALAQAFEAVYIRMNAEPLKVDVKEKGGHDYSMEQIRNMREMAAKFRADFAAMIIVPGSTRPGPTPGTISVSTSVRW